MAKFKVETTIESCNPKDWKFKIETTERKIKKNIIWFFFEYFVKRRVKTKKKQMKVNLEQKGVEKIIESEVKES